MKDATEDEKQKEKQKPNWVAIKPAEIEKIVVVLHKQGNTPAKIGLILRDKHGIPKAKLLGKKIKKILSDAEQSIVPEIVYVQEKVNKLEAHLLKNKHDYTARRSLNKKMWIITKSR